MPLLVLLHSGIPPHFFSPFILAEVHVFHTPRLLPLGTGHSPSHTTPLLLWLLFERLLPVLLLSAT